MRLIDADKLAAHLERRIEYAPTIDPETLPIVRELRAELERVTVELHKARESCEATKKKYAACAQRLRQIQ